MRYTKGLRVDTDSGEGEVNLPEAFHEMNALWQADVLGDWIIDLEALYRDAMRRWAEELASVRAEKR